MSNVQTKSLVTKTISLLTKEEAVRGEAIQTLVYLLVTAHVEGTLPQNVLLKEAYKHTERGAQALRNNLFLTHMFGVMSLVTTESGPVYKVNEGVEPRLVALLKTRLNRTLIVAAWIASKLTGTTRLVDICKHNPNGLMSVRGSLYLTKEQLAAAPDVAENWISLDGKKSLASGKYEVLATQATKGLGWSKQSSGTKADPVAAANLNKLSTVMTGKLELLQADDKPISQANLATLQALFVTLSDAIKHVEKNVLPAEAAKPVNDVTGNKSQRRAMTDAEIADAKKAATSRK